MGIFKKISETVNAPEVVERKPNEITNLDLYNFKSELKKDVDEIKVKLTVLQDEVKSLKSLMMSVAEQVIKPSGKEEVEEEEELPRVPEGEALLSSLDMTNTSVIANLIEWLKFLMEKVGRDHLRETLDYYVTLGWISEDVKQVLLRYSKGIESKKVGKLKKLSARDHLKSMEYINKLRSLR
ncbi:MAG TPA: hypothetical protein ENF51_00315 [Candidatus Aenigmarchaeota archaeon]|nr:hypothetical protein [Candidatus Aenigmarchaeota archaeon]